MKLSLIHYICYFNWVLCNHYSHVLSVWMQQVFGAKPSQAEQHQRCSFWCLAKGNSPLIKGHCQKLFILNLNFYNETEMRKLNYRKESQHCYQSLPCRLVSIRLTKTWDSWSWWMVYILKWTPASLLNIKVHVFQCFSCFKYLHYCCRHSYDWTVKMCFDCRSHDPEYCGLHQAKQRQVTTECGLNDEWLCRGCIWIPHDLLWGEIQWWGSLSGWEFHRIAHHIIAKFEFFRSTKFHPLIHFKFCVTK